MRLGTPEFVGSRLREARECRGLTGIQLSDLVGITRQAVSQYEKGLQTPAPEVMERICEILRMPKSHFLIKSSESLGSVFFRSFASSTKTERLRQCQRQRWRKRAVRFLRQYVTIPDCRIPQFFVGNPQTLSHQLIENYAAEMRRHFELGNGPISDVALLLENNGAILFRTEFAARSLDAFSEWSDEDRAPYIVLNAEKRSAVRSRFDAAHELAHMVLHRHVTTVSHPNCFKTMENDAHYFAAAFLAPAESFSSTFRFRSIEDLVGLKKFWGMAISAIARRALQLSLITDSVYRRIMTEIGKRGWRTREPLDNELMCEQPRLMRRAVSLLIDGGIVDRRNFANIGSGSLRDVEDTLGLIEGTLDTTITRSVGRSTERERGPRVSRPRVIPFADSVTS